METQNIHQVLKSCCLEIVATRLESLNQSLLQAREAANEDTKSSAGDKHETGRAMAQLEQEKLGKQIQELTLQLDSLQRLTTTPNATRIGLGNIVRCESFTYYLCIALGKIELAGNEYFAISANSPIAQLMLGKGVGHEFTFNNKTQKILAIY